MLVRCEKCGYENFPQHRFCGMCGAGLRLPQPAADRPNPPAKPPLTPSAPPERPAMPAASRMPSRSSFLNLSDRPGEDTDVSYLLEDEPSPGHTGRYVFLILVIATLAAAGWYWRGNLRAWAGRLEGVSNTASASPPGTTSSPEAAAGNTAQNGAPQNATPLNSTPAPSSPSPAPTQTAPSASPPQAAPPVPPPAAVPPTTPPPAAALPAQAAPDQATVPSQPDQSPAPTAVDNQAAPTTPAAPDSSKLTTAKAANRAAEPTPAVPDADDVEAQGEKYLYGNGVAQNCARAQKSLLAAAARSNARAQSVLGTMYATGHCATRDLPAAYRWFARALHQDPSNSRVEQDLKVLWGQMTPEERQVALQAER
jgi:outer membrane biosynthesis protein TonB